MIQALVKPGVCQQDIATMLGVHPKTLRRGLARDGAPTGPAKRASPLDSYKPRVDALLQEGVWNAVVVWRERQGMGYPGEVSIIRAYIRPKRPLGTGRDWRQSDLPVPIASPGLAPGEHRSVTKRATTARSKEARCPRSVRRRAASWCRR